MLAALGARRDQLVSAGEGDANLKSRACFQRSRAGMPCRAATSSNHCVFSLCPLAFVRNLPYLLALRLFGPLIETFAFFSYARGLPIVSQLCSCLLR